MATSSLLFESLQLELEKYYAISKTQSIEGVLSFPPSEIDRAAEVMFGKLKNGGFCTHIVSGRPWDPSSIYFAAARNAAKRGLEIERVFLLPHSYSIHEECLRNHVQMDQAAGITVQFAYIGQYLSDMRLPSIASLDFGFWDEEVLCSVRHASGAVPGAVEWKVTRRPEDIQNVMTQISLIKKKAEKPAFGTGAADVLLTAMELNLEEPMVTTAPIAQFLANVVCRGDFVSKEDCSWYHAIWQYLRIFNLVSTPTWHSEFYREALGHLSSTGHHNRILISGTADYSMLAHVISAYRRSGGDPRITVLDLCETPLLLCKWYGKLVQLDVEIVSANLFDYDPDGQFDVIVTDAFLTRFPRLERPRVIQKWGELLRPDGKLITTIRLDPGVLVDTVLASEQQIRAFVTSARTEAQNWRDFLDITPAEIATGAERYAKNMISHPFNSSKEVRDLLLNRFTIERLDENTVPGEMTRTVYAEVVANRNGERSNDD